MVHLRPSRPCPPPRPSRARAHRALAPLAAVAVAAAPALATAQNLVVNPGFETGTTDPFTVVNGMGTGYQGVYPVVASHAHSGEYAAFVYDRARLNPTRFEQAIATVPGDHYLVSYWAEANQGASPSHANGAAYLLFGDTGFGGPLSGQYQQFTRVVTATSATTRFQLSGYPNGADNSVYFDDLSVVHLLPPPAPYTDCATVVGNFVRNCGFEGSSQRSGPFLNDEPTGYTVTFNNGGESAYLQTQRDNFAHSRRSLFSFLDNQIDSGPQPSATLSQTLTGLTPGATYAIQFYAQDNLVWNPGGGGQNRLTVTFGGQTLFDQAVTNRYDNSDPDGIVFNADYRLYTLTGVATGDSTTLAFTGWNNSETDLDDLSVVGPIFLSGPATTAPEPATWALLGAGLLAVGGVARRRRRA